MTEAVMQLMEESLGKARALAQDSSVVWKVRTPSELCTEDCPNPVEYSAENKQCHVVLISGQDKSRGRFASGVLTTTANVGGAPVLLNLPPDFVDEMLKAALQSVLSRN